MPKRVNFDVKLPDEIIRTLGEKGLGSKTKEALIMQLLREHHISQEKAAQLMGISRQDLLPLMEKYRIS